MKRAGRFLLGGLLGLVLGYVLALLLLPPPPPWARRNSSRRPQRRGDGESFEGPAG